MAYFPNSFAANPTTSAPQAIHSGMVDSCHFVWGRNSDEANQKVRTPSPSLPHQLQRPHSWIPSINPKLRPCSNKFYHLLMCGHRVRTVIPEACAENCLEPWEFGTATGRFYCSDCLDDQYNAELQRMQAQQQEIYQSQSIPIEEQQSRYSALLQQLDKEFLEYKAREVTASRETIPCPPLEHKGEVMDVASDLDSLSLSLTQTTTNTSRNSTASPQQLPTTLANRRDLPTDPSQQLHLSLSGLALDRGSCGVEEKFEGYPAAMPDMESEEL